MTLTARLEARIPAQPPDERYFDETTTLLMRLWREAESEVEESRSSTSAPLGAGRPAPRASVAKYSYD